MAGITSPSRFCISPPHNFTQQANPDDPRLAVREGEELMVAPQSGDDFLHAAVAAGSLAGVLDANSTHDPGSGSVEGGNSREAAAGRRVRSQLC